MSNEHSIELLGQKISYPDSWFGLGSVFTVCTALVLIIFFLDPEKIREFNNFKNQSHDSVQALKNNVIKADKVIAAQQEEIESLKKIIAKSKDYSEGDLSSTDPVGASDISSWFNTQDYANFYPTVNTKSNESKLATKDYLNSLEASKASLNQLKVLDPTIELPKVGVNWESMLIKQQNEDYKTIELPKPSYDKPLSK